MTHTERLGAVRQKCIEANPTIVRWGGFDLAKMALGGVPESAPDEVRPIRLADVLLAIGKAMTRGNSYFVDADGGFHEWFAPQGRLDLRTVGRWNLRADDLSQQSEETIDFIASLLA